MASNELMMVSGWAGYRSKLDNLPREIQLMIHEYVSSKSSLHSLALVSKMMYHTVLPALYHTVSLAIKSSDEPHKANAKFKRMAYEGNPGLIYIRDLTLIPEDALIRYPVCISDYPDAVRLLKAIPRDTLRRFSWDWLEVPSDILRLLWTRQRKLTNAEFVTCKRGIDNLVKDIGQDLESFHEHATRLRITNLRETEIPGTVAHILQSRRINSLTLDFWDDRVHADRTHNAVPTSFGQEMRRNVLLSGLFSPAHPLKQPYRLALKELHLQAVNLRHNCSSMLATLDTTVLEELDINSCRGPWSLFNQMSKLPSESRPRLRSLRIFFSQPALLHTPWASPDDHTDRTTKSINNLLLSMNNSLSTLWVVMRGMYGHESLLDPLAPGLANHGQSLIRLTVDIRGHLPPFVDEPCADWFSQNTWEELCTSMAKLEQLYVPFPPMLADQYLEYRPDFKDYMTTILRIPSLKSLNMNTWPISVYTELYDPAGRRVHETPAWSCRPFDLGLCDDMAMLPVDFYRHCLLLLANWIVKQRSQLICGSRCPLKVIGFGLPERGQDPEGGLRYMDPVYFVEGLTAGGETVMRQQTYWEVQDSGYGGLLSQIWGLERLTRKRRRVAVQKER